MGTSWRSPKTQEELKICTQSLKNQKILIPYIAMRFYIHSVTCILSIQRISNVERILFKKQCLEEKAQNTHQTQRDLNAKDNECLEEEMVLST